MAMLSHMQHTAPLTRIVRPQLPFDHLNPNLKSMTADSLPPVRFQEIVSNGHSTIVARMKIPTPHGHAFVIHRLDTNAISLTSLYRAAFSTANDNAEEDESDWVKANYDGSGLNDGSGGKAYFAGTWINPGVAKELAESYTLAHIVTPLIKAKPDHKVLDTRCSLGPAQAFRPMNLHGRA
ncbi:hypothetical protein OF83DRAFT_1175180 [Amylostereum chailletii]|nr:hypothetical protein OF83DRAFT_1175180 [Amylostereum chailletii]